MFGSLHSQTAIPISIHCIFHLLMRISAHIASASYLFFSSSFWKTKIQCTRYPAGLKQNHPTRAHSCSPPALCARKTLPHHSHHPSSRTEGCTAHPRTCLWCSCFVLNWGSWRNTHIHSFHSSLVKGHSFTHKTHSFWWMQRHRIFSYSSQPA